MFEQRKKHSFLKIAILLIFCAAIGMVLGYASVRYKNFPFYDKLNPPAHTAPPQETITIPTPEPVFTSVSENNKIDAEEPQVSPTPTYNYIVKADGGKVYLFKTDNSGNIIPENLLPINLNALKEEDKKLLISGISISNKQELASVLEDFGS